MNKVNIDHWFVFRYPSGMKPGEKLVGKISYSHKANVSTKVSIGECDLSEQERPSEDRRFCWAWMNNNSSIFTWFLKLSRRFKVKLLIVKSYKTKFFEIVVNFVIGLFSLPVDYYIFGKSFNRYKKQRRERHQKGLQKIRFQMQFVKFLSSFVVRWWVK